MNNDPDLDDFLAQSYAHLDVRDILAPRFSEDNFCGFEPPYGWLELVVCVHEKLLPNPNYRIAQVKEKFGELRFYTEGLTSEQYDVVRAAQRESRTICQDCGSRENVALREHGWVATLCADCDRDYHDHAAEREPVGGSGV